MKVNLILKFNISDRNTKDTILKNIVDFNETTCIKNYKMDNYNVNMMLSGIEYYYNNVPLDRMNDLYSDVRKYDGKISIIINEFISSR